MRYFSMINRFSVMLAMVLTLAVQQKSSSAAEGPCDIYATGGTPCVAAYSTVRVLSSTYIGPLYQVRKTSDQSTKDIPALADGFADASVQETFLGTGAGTISKLYDQSGKGNNLTVAKKGCYTGTASQDDKESDAKGRSLTVNGHKVYALFMKAGDGYRSNQDGGYTGYPARAQAATGMPTGNQAQGVYEVADGKRYGTACCWNFGNGSTNNCYGPTGQMNTLFFGTAYWGKGDGNGPWFMNDMEAGVWAGGFTEDDPGWGALEMTAGKTRKPNTLCPSMTMDYAFGISKANTVNNVPQYALRMANAQRGGTLVPQMVTAYDGRAPTTWKMEGGILLGIGGDNSNSSYGTWFEGCITAGRPSDATDTLILKNVQDMRYGATDVATLFSANNVSPSSLYKVRYNPANAGAVISYTLHDARRVSMNIYDQQGRRIAAIVDGVISAGRHDAVWNANRVPAGVYVCRTTIDGLEGWTGRIVIGK
jgi:hypothetical protein